MSPAKIELTTLMVVKNLVFGFLKVFFESIESILPGIKLLSRSIGMNSFIGISCIKKEVFRHQEEVLHQILQCQAAMNNFWHGQFYLKVLFDWHFSAMLKEVHTRVLQTYIEISITKA